MYKKRGPALLLFLIVITLILFSPKLMSQNIVFTQSDFTDFESSSEWIASGTGQGAFEIGIPTSFNTSSECLTTCIGTGIPSDHSAIGEKAACTNLNGHQSRFENSSTNSLTSPVYDFSQINNINLELYRFMEIEGNNYDFCYYQYKTALNAAWTNFETYGNFEIDDNNWIKYTKDLSNLAANQSYFQLRFHCTTDDWTEGSGLCLDDVNITWTNSPSNITKITRPFRNLSKENGIVTNIWIFPESKLDNLKEHKIKYLFVDIGGRDLNGSLLTPRQEIINFINFIEAYEAQNNYDFILLPYSEINTYTYDISLQNFRENFISDSNELVSLGFDGILVDIEPVRFDQRDIYIDILKELVITLPEASIISVYAGNLYPFISDSNNEWEWSLSFYNEVSNLVDIITIPGYDTNINNKIDYQAYLRTQILNISSHIFNSSFTFAIPTHKPVPETIENALEVYTSEINPNNTQFLGLTIFAEWTTDESEWDIFKNFTMPETDQPTNQSTNQSSNQTTIPPSQEIMKAPDNFSFEIQPNRKNVRYSWDAVEGATGYKGHWTYANSGGPYSNHLELGNASSILVSYNKGIELYAVITAYNGTYETGYSNEIYVNLSIDANGNSANNKNKNNNKNN